MDEKLRHLINFYTDVGTDDKGRTHNDIIAFEDNVFEGCHDFIQWLFPTDKESAYNPNAPILDQEAIEILRSDAVFRARFKQSLAKILRFWELDYDLTFPENEQESVFIVKPILENKFWMDYDNHNLVRITRVMQSCALLGFRETARSLFESLLLTVKDNPQFYFIEPINLYHWYFACYNK